MKKNDSNTILIVDDEESLRGMLTQVFKEEGYRVKAAATGGEVTENLDVMSCDLAFIDLRLPDMSGIEVIRQIKNRYPDTELILITAYATLDNAVQALRAGVYDYLIKPVDDIHVLTSIARRAIEKRKLSIENRDLLKQLKTTNIELERANKVLSDMAIKDGLTDLFNHRYFQESLLHEVAASERFDRKLSVLLIDLDHFKVFNDTNGHQAGDRVLKEFSDILKSELRTSDIAARYGGEEFVLILPESGKEASRLLAEKIRKRVEDHPFNDRETQPLGCVSVSIGVATYQGDGEGGRTVVMQADQAMYRAKNTGRNRVCVAWEDEKPLTQAKNND